MRHALRRARLRWRGAPLRSRLILATLALLTAICLAIGVFSHLAMSSYLTGELDDQLSRAAGRAGLPAGPPPESVPPPSDAGLPEDVNPGNAAGQRPGTLNAVFVDGSARTSALVLDDGGTRPLDAADLALLAGVDPDAGPADLQLSGGRYRVEASRLPQDTSGDEAVLVTGLSTAERDSTLASLNITMTVLSLAGLLGTGVAGTVIIRRSLRPLEQLAATATSVSRLPLASGEVEIPVRVPPSAARPGSEVGTVGLALNGMIDHVTRALRARQASETKVRQFVADASHELRTPLTSIRGYTELVLLGEQVSPGGRAALERVDSEARRMSALVEDLLLLARLDEGRRSEPTEVDLTELVLETTRDAQVAARDHEWILHLPEEPVVLSAVEGELRQVLINLLANAGRHTAPGTRVDVELRTAGGQAEITVTDNGQGIDPAFVDSVFSRFSRGDAARTADQGSTGLGLAIVQALVAANGGTVDVGSRPGHTRFRVRLPVREAGGGAA